ncbi:FtsB family cell division protein [Blastochloris viridis]|uniref:Cell division protein DivIC n=1 Tax=Blastochloris viridis TaxID=1079 RepID=A0A0H5BIZ7_BLAVI|nr:septum formation initiator family protein [Blastochloris viridis]ALK09702.1 Septum formation initiator [Blastochloris viridis]BAS00407.1 cell division protein DivIC [Blastochloris viridis]CUU42365.1 Septum formation initiator [Blastochloris viridis]
MVVRPLLRRILSILLLYSVTAAGIAYFAFHGWNGDHGLQAKRGFEIEMARLHEELDAVRAERLAMEKKVALLRPQSLDPDMLDERARDLLNWAHPNDLVLVKRPSATGVAERNAAVR